jgi:hypothetical protein
MHGHMVESGAACNELNKGRIKKHCVDFRVYLTRSCTSSWCHGGFHQLSDFRFEVIIVQSYISCVTGMFTYCEM